MWESQNRCLSCSAEREDYGAMVHWTKRSSLMASRYGDQRGATARWKKRGAIRVSTSSGRLCAWPDSLFCSSWAGDTYRKGLLCGSFILFADNLVRSDHRRVEAHFEEGLQHPALAFCPRDARMRCNLRMPATDGSSRSTRLRRLTSGS